MFNPVPSLFMHDPFDILLTAQIEHLIQRREVHCDSVFPLIVREPLYSIYYWYEHASSSVHDVGHYVIIGKLLASVFNILLVLHAGGKFIDTYAGLFFRKVAYTRYDLLWFIE
jgi:uncharacterized membrane protein YraQ (UPF0718 family)